MTDARRELAEAFLLFLDRHEAALLGPDAARALASLDGLEQGLGELRAQAGLQDPSGARPLARRCSEAEGALLALRVSLAQHAEGWAQARRAAWDMLALARALAGLRAVLALWSGDAWRGPPRAQLRAAREALLAGEPEAARVAVQAALARALVEPTAGASWEDALERWGRAPGRRFDVAEARRVFEASSRPLHDLETWALLEAAERLVEEAGMSGAPS